MRVRRIGALLRADNYAYLTLHEMNHFIFIICEFLHRDTHFLVRVKKWIQILFLFRDLIRIYLINEADVRKGVNH